MPDDLVIPTREGMFCPAGGFHIDPWYPVEHAVITHAHTDHARRGMKHYLCAARGEGVLRARLRDASIESLNWGEARTIGEVRVSFHPAGHVLGSAQVRLEHRGQVWVASGDYKRHADPTCDAFEPQRCHTFITECTFGLPIYQWPDPQTVHAQINEWWRMNRAQGRTSIVYCYALGKAQRVLAGLDPSIGPIIVHGAVANLLPAYEAAGVRLPAVHRADADNSKAWRGRAVVIAPQSVQGTPWLRRFNPVSGAVASGWALIRGKRRRRSADRGFVLSDHADWPSLLRTIEETGATRVGVTHGQTGPMVRYLRERGLDAWSIPTRFVGEESEAVEQEEVPPVVPDPPAA